MSEEDTQPTTAESEARGAELRENLAMTDARRAEEEVARAQADKEAAAAAGSTAFPGSDKLPDAAQRPEVLIGATVAGAFVLARILKRIFD